jgi:hypothetical protein
MRHTCCVRTKVMNQESREENVAHPPTAVHTNGSARTLGRRFARRAVSVLSELPSSIESEIKQNPYRAMAIACGIGIGAGMLLGSRVLRSALVTVVSYAFVELGRAYLQDATERANGRHQAPAD